jgi:hypothetical protein
VNVAGRPLGEALGQVVRAELERDGILTADEAATVNWRTIGEAVHRELNVGLSNGSGLPTGELRRRLEKAFA